MTEFSICSSCGKGYVIPVCKSGRHMVFRNFSRLDIPASVPIPTCSNCGEEWYDAETTQDLEHALEKEAADVLGRIANDAIGAIAEQITQRDLEDLLDLSRGYLSKIKHQKETPSAALVALLSLLAKRPGRVEEVRLLWDSRNIGPLLVTTSASFVQKTSDIGMLEVAR